MNEPCTIAIKHFISQAKKQCHSSKARTLANIVIQCSMVYSTDRVTTDKLTNVITAEVDIRGLLLLQRRIYFLIWLIGNTHYMDSNN